MTWRDTFASLSTEDKIAAAILCAWPTTDSIAWRRWAVGWLTGEDRTESSAHEAWMFPVSPYSISPSALAARSAAWPQWQYAADAIMVAEGRHHIDPSPILDDIAAGDLQRHVDRVEQELACAP